jgi:hypothetical protein
MALRIGEERFAPSSQSTQDLLSRQLTKLGRPNAVHKKTPARQEAGRGSSRAVSQGVWKAARG